MMRLQRLKLRACFALCAGAALVLVGVSVPTQAAFINLTPTVGTNSDGAVVLSNLISGEVDGITVGDKVFSGFSYSRLGDMPLPNDVQVLGFKDANNNWGISFHGVFVDMPGGTFSDALIRYTVEVSSAAIREGYLISDAHLYLGGLGVGPDSVFTVDESFLETNQIMNAYVSTIGTGGLKSSDWVDILPTQTKLHVTKDILAIAGANSFLPARATAIDQAFSQIRVPEPVAALLVLGFAGGMFLRKRP